MRTVFGPTVLDGFGQFGNGAVQFTVGAPVLRLLLRQFIFDVEQHGLDDVELIGHLRFHVVQSILDFPWQSNPLSISQLSLILGFYLNLRQRFRSASHCQFSMNFKSILTILSLSIAPQSI